MPDVTPDTPYPEARERLAAVMLHGAYASDYMPGSRRSAHDQLDAILTTIPSLATLLAPSAEAVLCEWEKAGIVERRSTFSGWAGDNSFKTYALVPPPTTEAGE